LDYYGCGNADINGISAGVVVAYAGDLQDRIKESRGGEEADVHGVVIINPYRQQDLPGGRTACLFR
jgi:hypothetical protein